MGFEYRLVDPGLLRHDRGVWPAAEPLGVGVVGGGESVLPGLVDRAGGPEMDRGGGVPGDPGMTVDVVVLVEEAGAELPGVGERGEGCRELGQVLEGLVVSTNAGGGERWRFTERGAVWEMEVAGPPEPLCGERL